ncbi:hypothetical protein BC828DRAFT_406864 [Blastocladiella britannica]|nr:hypothetical protein BC828DRAFT_406864 [Blastocladiella britannica]
MDPLFIAPQLPPRRAYSMPLAPLSTTSMSWSQQHEQQHQQFLPLHSPHLMHSPPASFSACHPQHFVFLDLPSAAANAAVAVTLTGSFDHWSQSVPMHRIVVPADHAAATKLTLPTDEEHVKKQQQAPPLELSTARSTWTAAVPLPFSSLNAPVVFKFVVERSNGARHWETCALYGVAPDDHGNLNNQWRAGDADPARLVLQQGSGATDSALGSASHLASPVAESPAESLAMWLDASALSLPTRSVWSQIEDLTISPLTAGGTDKVEAAVATISEGSHLVMATSLAERSGEDCGEGGHGDHKPWVPMHARYVPAPGTGWVRASLPRGV